MYQVKKTIHGDKCRLTGRGIGVAILDTGINPHPDFEGRIVAFRDFVGRRAEPYDDNSHGTHIAGVIGARSLFTGGKLNGMAPGCHFIVAKVLDDQGNG